MKRFEITSSTQNSNYNYKNDYVVVQGNFVKDATSGALQSINGQCYHKDAQGNQGQYIGNFNGYPQNDGNVTYDLSQMSRADSNLVWDAIDDIEVEVLGVDE